MGIRVLGLDGRMIKDSGFSRFIARLNSIHAALAFAVPFLLFFPVFLLVSIRPRWHRAGLVVHNWWAKIFFGLMMLPLSIDWRFRPKKHENYIFCANHFSYLDIPAMGLMGVPFKFIGKQSLAKVPLFGYMFRKLHVPVERGSTAGRARSQKKVLELARLGYSMTYFPEGGMISTEPPKMVAFKEGAFRLAAELDWPIVPVSLCTNYKVLPDDPKLYLYRGPVNIVVHPPIMATGKSKEDLQKLKEQVRAAIESGLKDNSVD